MRVHAQARRAGGALVMGAREMHGSVSATGGQRPPRHRGLDHERWRAVWRRRARLAIAAFLVPAAVALTFAAFLPDVYRATATVLVDRQPVSENLAKASVTTDLDTRLQTISEEILSPPRLGALAEELGVLSGSGRSPRQLGERMRQDIRLDLKSVDRKRQGDPTVAFTITYRNQDPVAAARVANALAGLYVERNSVVRDRQVTGTASLLEGRIKEARRRLDDADQRLAEFRRQHADRLPEQMPMNMTVLEQLRTQLRFNAANQARTAQRGPAPSTGDGARASGAQTPEARLAQLREQLVLLQAEYGEKYPDVLQRKAEIAALEGATAQTTPSRAPALSSQPPTDPQLAALKAEEADLRQTIAMYEKRVLQTAVTEREMQALVADLDSARDTHRTLSLLYEEARLAETVAHERKNEQFRVLDAAVPATSPSGPNRLALAAGGLLVALGAAVGAAVIAERLDPSVLSADDLRAIKPLPIAGSIPLLVRRADRRRRRRQLAVATLTVVGAVAAAAGATYVTAHDNTQLSAMLTGTRP